MSGNKPKPSKFPNVHVFASCFTSMSAPVAHSANLFIAREIPGLPKIDIFLEAKLPPRRKQINLAKNLRLTKFLSNACLVVIPHEWALIRGNRAYVNYLKSLSQFKTLLIFNTGDVSPKVFIPNSVEIRTFLHPGEKSSNKIIVPYPIAIRDFERRKLSETPTISFMGFVPNLSIGSFVGLNGFSMLHPIMSSPFLVRKISIFKLKRLKSKFQVNLVVRKKFTSVYKNIDFDRHSVEFQKQLYMSDYVLCPRGFGNTSMRFYETISAGRRPILIQTLGQLPKINQQEGWSKHVLIVRLFSNWTRLILKDWQELAESENDYEAWQMKQRNFFREELSFEQYLARVFDDFICK